MTRTALIDGDIVAYRAASAVQRTYEWGDGVNSPLSDPAQAIQIALGTIRAWATLADCPRVRVCFTGRNNFRKRVLPTYKFNRAGNVKPVAYRETVEAIESRYRTDVVDGLEADDLLGILATTPRYAEGSVIVTIDKDLRTVPGWHLNPLKERSAVRILEPAADRKWMLQTLTGDPADGYAGCPGIGPAKGEKALAGASLADWWPQVVATFHNAKLTEEDALVQARVARILRRLDYDTPNKEIILWHPTTPVRIPLVA